MNLETNIGTNNNSATFPESIGSETHTKEDIKEMMEKQKELIPNVENQMDKVENNENVTQTVESQPVSTETNNINI